MLVQLFVVIGELGDLLVGLGELGIEVSNDLLVLLQLEVLFFELLFIFIN